MNSEMLMDAIGNMDEKYILKYENIDIKPKRGWVKYVLPIVACLAIALLTLPDTSKHNESDKEYEAKHRRFTSISEAEREFGNDYLFSVFSGYDNVDILVGYVDKESIFNPSAWTDIDVFIENENESISLVIYSSLYTGTYWGSGTDYETMDIGDTSVRYKLYGPGSGFSSYRNSVFADFTYEGCHYVFVHRTNNSVDEAYELLKQMLEK